MIHEIFESYADNAFDENTKENSLTWKREWYNANFRKFFPKDFSAKLLDIGPGLGELLITEREWGYVNGRAIDISPSVADYCKNRGLECECVADSAEWLKEHKNCYEVITLLDVFEHIPQSESVEFLKACKGALSDTGILILQVPNIQSAESFLHRYNDLTHVFGYSQHTLEQLISMAGFETVRLYPFEEYPGDDADRKMIRRLRSIYWKALCAGRQITHNLNPEILTPELFAVLSRNKCELPDNELKGEFDDNRITFKDVKDYFDKLGVNVDAFDEICSINDLRNSFLRKSDELDYWITSELENRRRLFEELKEMINDKSREYNEIRNILEDTNSVREEREMELRALVSDSGQRWNAMLDEQNGRLVKFIDERIERLDEHNGWTRNRLDELESGVEKLNTFVMKLRHPWRFILGRKKTS